MTNPTIPAPGDLKARHVATLRRMLEHDEIARQRGDQGFVSGNERTALDYTIAALSALPAGGVEESSRTLFGCAYQLAGYHDAPEAWLDRLSDAMQGRPLPDSDTLIAQLLPYAPTTTPQPSAAENLIAAVPSDDELPGMWSGADLIGGKTDAVGAQRDRLRNVYLRDMEDALRQLHAIVGLESPDVDALIEKVRRLAAPAAGKGVDDAMVRLAWRDAYGAWLETKNRGSLSEADDAAVSALAAALTRQPVAGGGMVLGANPKCHECGAALLYECAACSATNYPPAASPDYDLALHWIDRYAAGIDYPLQMDRVCEALGLSEPPEGW